LTRARRRAWAVSRGVHCSSECCVHRRIEGIGFLRSHADLTVSGEPRGLPRDAVPVSFYRNGSSSRELRSPSETLQLSPVAAVHVNAWLRRLPWGFVPLREISVRSPHPMNVPPFTFVPPSGFLALSTVSSSEHLAGLFHPAPTSRFIASGVSSHDPGVNDSSSSLPSSPLASGSCRIGYPTRRRPHTRRPRGLA